MALNQMGNPGNVPGDGQPWKSLVAAGMVAGAAGASVLQEPPHMRGTLQQQMTYAADLAQEIYNANDPGGPEPGAHTPIGNALERVAAQTVVAGAVAIGGAAWNACQRRRQPARPPKDDLSPLLGDEEEDPIQDGYTTPMPKHHAMSFNVSPVKPQAGGPESSLEIPDLENLNTAQKRKRAENVLEMIQVEAIQRQNEYSEVKARMEKMEATNAQTQNLLAAIWNKVQEM